MLEYKLSRSNIDQINSIIEDAFRRGHISINEDNVVTAAYVIVKIYLILNKGRYLENFNFFNNRNRTFFSKLQEEVCRITECEYNREYYKKKLEYGGLDIILIARPDAFCSGLPTEIKTIRKNAPEKYLDIIKSMGEMQSSIYGYILDEDKAYLIVARYDILGNNIKVNSYSNRVVMVNKDILEWYIGYITEKFILPYLEKSLTPRAGFEPASPYGEGISNPSPWAARAPRHIHYKN